MVKALVKAVLYAVAFAAIVWATDRSIEATAQFQQERVQQHIDSCKKAKALYRLEHN